MCFSASASFIASGVLAIIALLSIASVKDSRFYLLACIPLFFSLQQFCEGLIWVYGYPLAAQSFLFFALGVWPIAIPSAFALIEMQGKMKRQLEILSVLGAALSTYLLVSLALKPLVFSAQGCHIVYDITPLYPLTLWLVGILYVFCTIAPFFISTQPYTTIFGGLVAFSCIVSALLFTHYFTSVWCFFAAVLSGMTLLVIRKR